MKEDKRPMVSVLMTAYNRELYIGEAIESVLASTYTNFELIITDDCSTDKTLEIARGYEKKDNRITVYKNNSNLKDYPNRNKAAVYATGKYIKYLDSDDILYPNGLEYCVTAMEENPDAGMGMLFFQKEISGEDAICWDPDKTIHHHFFVRGCLSVGPSGSIFRRDVFEALQGFDTRFGVASDNFFNIILAAKYPVVFLPLEFFFYRVHEGQEQVDKRGYLKYNYLYLKELVEKVNLPLSPAEMQQLRRKVANRYAKEVIRYLIKTQKLAVVSTIMRETHFSVKDMIKALLN